jgi:hypothetical protein
MMTRPLSPRRAPLTWLLQFSFDLWLDRRIHHTLPLSNDCVVAMTPHAISSSRLAHCFRAAWAIRLTRSSSSNIWIGVVTVFNLHQTFPGYFVA